MNSARIVLNPRQDLTAEQARDARARAWTYVFQSFYRRNGKETVEPAPEPDTRDEAKE
jgi:hypothetical protein